MAVKLCITFTPVWLLTTIIQNLLAELSFAGKSVRSHIAVFLLFSHVDKSKEKLYLANYIAQAVPLWANTALHANPLVYER